MNDAIYIIGDIHGQLPKLIGLLRAAGLIDEEHRWTGGTSTLWFIGDLVDRGDSLGVVDLVMRLQEEAAAVGGSVGSLLGNHEVLLLGAARFGDYVGGGGPFLEDRRRNGGDNAELDRLTPRQIRWISRLPAMVHTADRLLIHADSRGYRDYGDSIEAVNAACAAILQGDDPEALNQLLGSFSGRLVFDDNHTPDGTATARAFLARYGGRQIIHGHTPLSKQSGQRSATINAPWIYAGGLCVNVDAGLYMGAPGFVYRLPPLD